MILTRGASGEMGGDARLKLLGGHMIDATDGSEHDDVGEARVIESHGLRGAG